MIWRILQWISRLALGGLFIYAGFSKLYPREHQFLFEMALSSYQLLPVWGVVVVARLLPWLEMGLGVLLLVGWKLRYVATFTVLLLSGFIAVMAVTYFRGIEADCGCFGFGEPISPSTLARDSVFLLMAVFLAVRAWVARRAATSQAG